MEKLRVVIGSNDGATIADTHMGDTECFHVYDVFKDAEPELVGKRDNIAIDMGHAKIEKMKGVLAIVKDADVLVARKKSPNFVRIARNTKYQPVVVAGEAIADVLAELRGSFDKIHELVRQRSAGEAIDIVLELARGPGE
jgi:hypothetical protein